PGSGSRRGPGRAGQTEDGDGKPSGGVTGALGEGARSGRQDPRSPRQAGAGPGGGSARSAGGPRSAGGGSAGGARSGGSAGGAGGGGGSSGGIGDSGRLGSGCPALGTGRVECRTGTASG